jgi:hypothetical protein
MIPKKSYWWSKKRLPILISDSGWTCMMNGFEYYDNVLMEEEKVFRDVKWPIEIESMPKILKAHRLSALPVSLVCIVHLHVFRLSRWSWEMWIQQLWSQKKHAHFRDAWLPDVLRRQKEAAILNCRSQIRNERFVATLPDAKD